MIGTMNNLALKFIAPGTPVAKGRARVSSRGGFIRHYTPEKTVSYENTVRGYAVQAMRKANMQIIDVPCGLELMIYMPIPAKWSKSKKEKAPKGKIIFYFLNILSRKISKTSTLKALKNNKNQFIIQFFNSIHTLIAR